MHAEIGRDSWNSVDERVSSASRAHLKHISSTSQAHLEHISNTSQAHLKHISVHLAHISRTSRAHLAHIPRAQVWPASQLLLVQAERLFDEPVAQMERVFSFIGLRVRGPFSADDPPVKLVTCRSDALIFHASAEGS